MNKQLYVDVTIGQEVNFISVHPFPDLGETMYMRLALPPITSKDHAIGVWHVKQKT